jgi:prepilin-type N-terminal cleavage/methylation domain-containing protein
MLGGGKMLTILRKKLFSRARSQRGFTLVELLIALAITGFIATGSAAVTTGLYKHSKAIFSQNDAIVNKLRDESTSAQTEFSGGSGNQTSTGGFQDITIPVETPDAQNLIFDPPETLGANQYMNTWPYYVYENCAGIGTYIWPAQTFTATKTGELTRVAFKTGYVYVGSVIIVELRNVTASGEPIKPFWQPALKWSALTVRPKSS